MGFRIAQRALPLAAAITLIGSAAAAQPRPLHLDPSQPLAARVAYLVSQLTLEEKTSLLGTSAPAIDRLNIPEMWGWNQSLHGVVWNQPTTMFPVNIGMAATWNPALIQEVASVIHDEARAVYNLLRSTPGRFEAGPGRQCCLVTEDGRRLQVRGLVYRSPVINMSRQPLWGRVHETFGEDPHLTSRMTVAYVRGMQGDHPTYLKTVATLKHFAMNNQEMGRYRLNTDFPERWAHEYFFPQFRAGIVEGGAQSIMSVYNRLNGVPGAANTWLMTEMLRDRWGFEGFGVPDSNAIPRMVEMHGYVDSIEEAAAISLLAGHDLSDQVVGEGVSFPEVLPRAVQLGLVTEADVDRALRRVLTVRFRLGEFDPPELVPYNQLSPSIIGAPQHRELALAAARQSIVLLRNENAILPLDRGAIRRIAVIGPHADRAMTGIGYTGEAANFVKPIDGIRNIVAPGTEVLYARGSGIFESDDPQASLAEAAEIARRADAAVVFVGTDGELEREGRDRTYLNLPMAQQQLIGSVLAANPNTVVVMVTAGPMSLTGPAANAPAVATMFMAGEEGGNAVAEVLFGEYNPGGKLPYTVYTSHLDVPAWDEFDISRYPGYTYMYYQGQPSWHFGHGLSYTTFQYSNLRLSADQLPGDGRVTVSVDVRNTGERAGDEVVQLYVRDLQPPVVRPVKQLRGFDRITLNPGQQQTVSFTLSAKDLAYYDVGSSAFVVQPGPFEIMAGSSSADIRETSRIQVTSAGQWPQ